jgi:putative salt-induced outer membrane protein
MKYSFLLLLLPIIANAQTKFNNETELALIQTGGNSSVETFNTKTASKWINEKRTYIFSGHYTLGSSESVDETTGDKEKVESAKNWDVLARYEQGLSQNVSSFLSLQVEGDTFSGYKQRDNLDLGAKYILSKTDSINSFAELGARYTIEKKTVRNEDDEDVLNYTKARLYYEIAIKSTEALSYKFWAEYIPNFTESDDYQITYEPSLSFSLSKTFSLKTAYKAVYDNQPNVDGYEYTDYTLTTSVLANF